MNHELRILILRLSSLGDILHTLPAFASLRATFPRARIDWLAAEQCRALVGAIRGVDRVLALDTRSLARFPPTGRRGGGWAALSANSARPITTWPSTFKGS